MPPHPHCHWRGLQDWKTFGLDFSTSSDEACKMFDACLTQMVNRYDDESVGGTEGCMKNMFQADPNFLIGHALKLGATFQFVHKDYAHAQEVYKLAEMAKQPHVKPWEQKHAQAVVYLSEGKLDKASDVWEDILVENPMDMMSLKFLHDIYVVNGGSQGLRDSCARVLPYWKPDTPFYGDLLGMYAFGLEESNMYAKAEKTAKQALDINRYDAWAAHCVAHCKEMTGEYGEGIKFMEETEKNWNDNGLLCHNYWHWALYHFENGDFETCMSILDNHVLPFMKSKKTMFSVTDVASLCFRLEAEGFDMQSRWSECFDVAKDHIEDNIWSYYDLNTMMVCLGSKHKDEADRLVASIKATIKEGKGDNAQVYSEVTLPLMEALNAYDDGEYDTAVEILKPLKYHIWKNGGSHAQRDVFNIFAIHAAMKSKLPENQRYANHLLMERKSQKESTPLADRLLQKLVISH
ncbi:tetratricopeptide repeat protein 38-like [Ruditapes philippinarum]|uniref:tetratricopeptide repeat protein 38-like n=1 Tax=Ruditapes philippinarum TaxID=129788 RepID=UPI00295B3B9D|nr:tetratricopeptide repeat protein 38-like [Ruditapes philippinarum]